MALTAGRPPHDPADFQRQQWRLQRVGWALALALVAGAVAGVFGDGPLSATVARSADGAHSVAYQRFLRRDAPSRLELHLATPARIVRFDRRYADEGWLQPLIPEPVQTLADGDTLAYRYADAAAGAQTLTFTLEPTAPQVLHARIRLDDGAAIAFRQLVYP